MPQANGVIDLAARPGGTSDALYSARTVADGVLELTLDQVEPSVTEHSAEVALGGATDQAEHVIPDHSATPIAEAAVEQTEPPFSELPATPLTGDPAQPTPDQTQPQDVAPSLVQASPPPNGHPELPKALDSAEGPPDARPASAGSASVEPERPGTAGVRSERLQDTIAGSINVQFQGGSLGAVSVRIDPDNELSLRVGDLLGLFEATMDKGVFNRLSASTSASQYISWAELREAGFTVGFDAASDQLVLGLE